MAEAAEELPPETPDNVVALPVPDAPIGIQRKAEGGLSLHFTFDLPKLPSLDRVSSWSHQQLINGGLILVVALLAGWTIYQAKFATKETVTQSNAEEVTNLRPNVATSFNTDVNNPVVGAESYVDRLASVIGDVTLGKKVFVAPFASIRGDEGQPIVIGDGSNVQDGVVIHALETVQDGKAIDKNLVTVAGKKYAVYVGRGVSLAHQSQVHGPAAVGDHTFVGMQALIFKATVGKNVVIEPGAKVIGVTIADKRYVPAGSTIATQAQADGLPEITADYPFATLNEGVLHVNEQFADGYLRLEEGAPSEAPAAAPKAGH